MIFIEKDTVYPIDKEIYKDEEEVQSNSFKDNQKSEEADLFEYKKANCAFTGAYEKGNY